MADISPPPSLDLSPASDTRVVADEEFERQLTLLRRTRRFLLEEGVGAGPPQASGESPLSLGRLNLIRCRPRGNPPMLADWELLEDKQDGLQELFNPDLQRRFRLRATQRTITWMPVSLLLLACLALAIAVFPPRVSLFGAALPGEEGSGWRFAAYLLWTSCLGSLGAIGFLAVNSLAIQRDATFDLSDRGLVGVRIVLGGLFGSVVSLPFCFSYFRDFTTWVHSAGTLDSGRGVLLLAPFLLGYSTSLVMSVLNRMLSGIETVFGIDSSTTRQQMANRIGDHPIHAERRGHTDRKPLA